MYAIRSYYVISLNVDAQLLKEDVNSYALNYWYTDPRSTAGGHSVLYWSAVAVFQTGLPALPNPQ